MRELESVYQDKLWLAGLDEAGRGPLAGPVVGACALVEKRKNQSWNELADLLKQLGVMDSKKSSSKKRRVALDQLGLTLKPGIQTLSLGAQETYRLHLCAQEISADEIDQINILRASLKSMNQSFQKIIQGQRIAPQDGEVWIDGNRCPQELLESSFHAESVVKGDAKTVLIGLASFLAKEYRDELMATLDVRYPGYGLSQHAGYPTVSHKAAIIQLGVSPIHRKSFKGVREHL